MAEAVRGGPEVAGGKNLELLSPTIGRQLLEHELRELIDETDLHITPVLLCDGIRLFGNPGGPRSGSDCCTAIAKRPR
ncbi:hypothetical protein ACGFY7_48670 [Streptomyces prunicolor]|uniref:hypothetical protein n=1 Tax=Streptomyces prunicolor TaxID=67348 RepID=UPI0037148C14